MGCALEIFSHSGFRPSLPPRTKSSTDFTKSEFTWTEFTWTDFTSTEFTGSPDTHTAGQSQPAVQVKSYSQEHS